MELLAHAPTTAWWYRPEASRVLSSLGSWVRLLEVKRMTNEGLRVPENPVDMAQVWRAEEMSVGVISRAMRPGWAMSAPMVDSC